MLPFLILTSILLAYLATGYTIFVVVEALYSPNSYEDNWGVRDEEERLMATVFWPFILIVLVVFLIAMGFKYLGKLLRFKSFEEALYTAIHNLKKSMTRKNKS